MAKRGLLGKSTDEVNNQDIFLYALYRLDGAGQFVDVEEVVQECWRLSPTRFGWRKLKYPSDRTGWAAVGHIEAARADLMLKTPNGLGRQLSAAGVEWVRDRLHLFERLATQETLAPKTRRASFRLVMELAKHPWTLASLTGEQPMPIERREAADLLRCSPDSPKEVWRQRLNTLRSAAADNERSDLLDLLTAIEVDHAEWFSEGAA
jgi:hypothetical protein